MSLRELNTRARRRLRIHGWLLTLWCLLVGGFSNWLLLRKLDVTTPAVRYAMSAIVMYSLGLVVGVRVWLRHFAAAVRDDAELRAPATVGEKMAFDHEREDRNKAAGKSFDWGDILGSAADLFSFDEAAVLLLIPAVILLVVGVLMLGGLLPVMLVDGLAGLLAEVAVQFVFGALIARRLLKPRHSDDAFIHIVGKTWVAGALLVLLSAVMGWGLRHIHPGAVAFGDLFR
ncbi:MAG: hypothetical protein ABI605_19395 [Rhizobacter sp.]